MKKTRDVGEMNFENALSELETIVEQLERGDVPLEKSIAIYERGNALRARCHHLLESAEARIEKIFLSRTGKPLGATSAATLNSNDVEEKGEDSGTKGPAAQKEC